MASSKKLPASKGLEHQLKVFLVDVFLSQQITNPKLLLAFSGGLDSSVLLHLLVETNKALPFQLSAQHVHHGLSKNADAWAYFCAETCKNLNIPFELSKVKVNKNSGLGVEATAREARYNALLDSDADFVLLAHHQDDQAETLLLQLARGAGVKGLAGMGAVNDKLLRPLLDAPRSAIETYAKQHNLAWIEDESNLDTKFDRNFMRHEILPKLEKQYPAIRQTISRASQNMAEANDLLDEIAAEDVKNCTKNVTLNLTLLQKLSTPRVHNALRFWLLQNNCDNPSAAQLSQMTQQLFYAKNDANIKINASAAQYLCAFQGNAFLVKKPQKIDFGFQKTWGGEDKITLPDGSHLKFTQKIGEGVALKFLDGNQLTIRYRQGGEALKPQANRPSRSLKTLLQNANIPPWQRERMPLLFLNEALAILPDIAVAASLEANYDELGLRVMWLDF